MAETVGERIKQLRGHLSQAEFASQMDVHEQTLGKYERNVRMPDADFLVKARRFGVTADWLLTGEEPVAPVAEADVALVEIVVATVQAWLVQHHGSLTPDRMGKLCAAVYRIVDRERRRSPFPAPSQAAEAANAAIAALRELIS